MCWRNVIVVGHWDLQWSGWSMITEAVGSLAFACCMRDMYSKMKDVGDFLAPCCH